MEQLYIVDVFAERRFGGNPLAVVVHDSALTDDVMVDVAREMAYSETTFVRSSEIGDRRAKVRIFTPVREIPFAGHPVLGTAYVLREFFGVGVGGGEIVLELSIGQVRVTVEGAAGGNALWWMEQRLACVGAEVEPVRAAQAVSLEAGDLAPGRPVLSVSTGFPFYVVPAAGVEELLRARIEPSAFKRLVEGGKTQAVLVYAPLETGAVEMRVFAPHHGIAEDPATGSAAGCLGFYLLREGLWCTGGSGGPLRIEQGRLVGRPSVIYVRRFGGGEVLEVGGRVQAVARGEFVGGLRV